MKIYFLLLYSLFLIISANAQSGPKLVGMSEYASAGGSIFQYIGGANSLSAPHYDFTYYAYPQSVTMTQGAGGKFYGLTAEDYINTLGSLIRYDYATNTYTPMVHFNQYTGTNPSGALLLASNNKFYGLTAGGGDPYHPSGTLFSYSEGDTFVTPLVNLPTGAEPVNSVIQASDGNLYGLTNYDGTSLSGTIFSYNISTGVYTTLYSLPLNAFPSGNLLEVGHDTLYGLTQLDGTEPSAVSSYYENSGTLFRYIISTDAYDTLHNMDSNATPKGSLIRGSDGLLYGTTSSDGIYGGGTIFSYNIATHVYTIVHNFGGANDGSNPCGDLYRASDGFYYGTTRYGYLGAHGAVFRYDIPTHTYTHLTDMVDSIAAYPNFGHLTEYFPAAIPLQPNSISTCPGTNANFIASDTTPALPVQWQVSANGGVSFVNITGATDSVYSFIVAADQNGNLYRAVFSHPGYNDTSVNATLTVYAIDTSAASAAICSGQTVMHWGRTFAAGGTYADTLHGASVHGCDSILLFHLTVYPLDTGYTNATICYGQAYFFSGFFYYYTGTYAVPFLHGSHGCDSFSILNLTVLPAASASITASVCAPQRYTLGTHTYDSSGTYTDTLIGAAVHGCDSFVVLYLSEYPLSSNSINASACLQYSNGGHTYTSSGTYIDTFAGASIHGCDSLLTINLSIYSPGLDTISASICLGSVYTIGSHNYILSGTYVDTLSGVSTYGCDSIILLHLSIVSPDTMTQNSTINLGQFLVVGHDTLYNAGTYIDTLFSREGCDSIVITHLTVIDGIAGIESYHFNLYPNPSIGSFTIQNNYPRSLSVNVINLLGERLKTYSITGSQQSFDISDLAAGIYEVQISDGNQTLQVMKVVKE